MDSGRPKSSNSEDSASCRISMYDDDDDDDEDTADRVGIIDYCLPPKTSNGTASSSDNYSLNQKPSPRSKGSSCNDYAISNSYARAQFERQVAARDAARDVIDQRQLIDRLQYLFGFGGSESGAASNSESVNELEKNVANDDAALDSLFQVDGYNELIHDNNSKVFDEELSCESLEPENDAEEPCCDDVKDDGCRMEFDEPCCDIEDERRMEFNALVQENNSEQFDEVLWIESDDDLGKNPGPAKRGYYSVDETVASNSEPRELLADSFLDARASGPKAGTNGYDAASHRRAYSSKYSGSATLSAVDRCSNLLSSCGYMGARSSMMDFEQKREQPRPLVCSDHEGEADASCGVGNYQAIQSDDSDDSTRFCERSSELNLPQHQPFFSRQDDFRSEGGTGDWLFRGNPLHASSLRGYGTPQYHLTRYGFSSELDQPSLASSRYYQLRQRRQSKRERQDAAVVDSTDVPGYKGNLGVEELLSYINDSNSLGHRSEGHSGVDSGVVGRSAEKAGRRRKKGSKGSEKPDRTESGSKSTERRTGNARVDSSTIKANERARVISACKLMNCVDAVSDDDDKTVAGDVCREQKVGCREQKVGDVLTSQTIGDSDLALHVVVCDIIPQGNMDSIRTVTVDQSLEKSRAPSGPFPVQRAMSADIPLQRAVSTEDDFTMVTKKKKSKKGNSKRGKPPRSDCLLCVPVSSDSTVSSASAERDFFSPLTATSKESASFSGYQTRTRGSALSKSSSAFRPSAVAKTVNKDAGFYLDDAEEDDWLAGEVETEVENDYGKAVVAVPAVTAVQIMPPAAPESWESNTDDSGAGRSNFLISQGKPMLQSSEKQEPTAKSSLESVRKEVAEEKQRSSKRPLAAKSKDLSVENLEMSPSGRQQNVSQDDVTETQSLSQDENAKPQQLFQEEEVISQMLSQDEEVISGNLSQDEKVISGNMSLDQKVISGNMSLDQKVISGNMSLDQKVISGSLYQDERVLSGNMCQDEMVISENLSQVEERISGNLSQDITVEPHPLSQNEDVISQTLAQDETEAFELVPQQSPQNDTSLSENPSQYETQMSENLGRRQDVKAEILARYGIGTSQFPIEQSLPQTDSPDNALFSAQAASVDEAFDTRTLPPSEQPVVFLDRQRRLFSVPAKRDLGLKFGHFDDYESAPDESRGTPPPYPGPINVIHYIPVPYNHDDGGGHDKPLPDSNSMMFPIPHQYLPQLMYANGPLCKPAFQVYPNGHLYPVPMQFAPFVPPGFCVLPPHTTNVPVGVVSPTMNNRPRDETLSSECADSIPIAMDGSDSCVPGFPAMQGIVMPTEQIVQVAPPLQPVPADAVLASVVSLSSSRRSKSAFNAKAAVEYMYSEWLDVVRRERGPNGGVVRYNPELDL